MGKGLRLEDLEVYKVAMEIGEIIWNVVAKWEYFAKKTLGAQYVEAADSIAMNISEGYGRFHYKENKNFCYYSRGSAKETLTATTKARERKTARHKEHQERILKNGQRIDFSFLLALRLLVFKLCVTSPPAASSSRPSALPPPPAPPMLA